MKSIVFWMLLIGWSVRLLAQEPLVEEATGWNDPESAASTEVQEGYWIRLAQFRRHPLNLNRAGEEELAELGLLEPMQIENWIRYRTRFGLAKSWYALQGVPGWDSMTLARIRPYVRLTEQTGWRELLNAPGSDRHFFLLRGSVSSMPSLPKGSLGGPVHALLRYQYQSVKGLEGGWLMEQDPGESLRKGGPDFFSFHVRLQVPGRSSKWLIGDHTVQLGQGLICWQGMSFTSGSDLASVKKQGAVIRPYHSVGESRFMRGLAWSGSVRNWVWDGFVSRHRQSAVLYTNKSGDPAFRNVDESGYHRTETERLRKNGLIENTAGGRVGVRLGRDWLHANFIVRNWSNPKMRLNFPRYEDTSFLQSMFNTSLDYSMTRGNWHGFGEYAVDAAGNQALILGSVMALHRTLETSLHLRWVGRRFLSVDGDALQQQSEVRAEQGLFVQVNWRLNAAWTIALYGDLYRIPIPSFYSETPAVGANRGIRFAHQPNKKRLAYLRIQSSDRVRNGIGSVLLPSTRYRQINWRGHAQWDLDTRFQLAVRAEQTLIEGAEARFEKGFLTYGELRYDPEGSGVRADARVMWVSTDGWNSRLYAYERNVLYKVGFPAFSGSLLRAYLNMGWQWDRRRTVWFHWGVQKEIENQCFNKCSAPISHSFTLQFRLELGAEMR